jgi:hypothetical protein
MLWRHAGLSLMLVLAGVGRVVAAQELTLADRPLERGATLTAGLGNTLGWFGAQGEKYFGGSRFSGFLGAGYTPSIDEGDPSGMTFAAGVRGYTAGFKHRGFLALSVSQLVVVTSFIPDESTRLYGPGVEVGYQFVSAGGFTVFTSAGVGWAPGVPEGESEFGEVLGVGLGYTWRR